MVRKTARIFNLAGKPVGRIELPSVFSTPLRPDLIRRAVLAMQTSRFHPQGRDPMAGKRTTAESRGTGMGIARIPRRKGPGGRGAFAPGTVGGRQGHPPTSKKNILKKIPQKERRLALLSAIAATASKEVVKARGHDIVDIIGFPLVVTNDFEGLKKTKEVEGVLIRLGILSDIFRVRESRKIRAGKGKSRGRKTKQASGPLMVVDENKGVVEAAENIPGVQAVTVTNLNVELLAPGTHPGRLAIWTSQAIEKLAELYGKGVQA